MTFFYMAKFNPQDHYFKKAKKENFAARSVFKLDEIDKKFKIFKPGDRVLDLGAAPGSWSQYASKVIGYSGRIVGIDLSPVEITLQNAVFFKSDIFSTNLKEIFIKSDVSPPFNVIMSDMAPKTTGIKLTDQARSLELCTEAFRVAKQYLKQNGNFVCKYFHGDDFNDLKKLFDENFKQVKLLKPKSTRKASKEIFFVCINFIVN